MLPEQLFHADPFHRIQSPTRVGVGNRFTSAPLAVLLPVPPFNTPRMLLPTSFEDARFMFCSIALVT